LNLEPTGVTTMSASFHAVKPTKHVATSQLSLQLTVDAGKQLKCQLSLQPMEEARRQLHSPRDTKQNSAVASVNLKPTVAKRHSHSTPGRGIAAIPTDSADSDPLQKRSGSERVVNRDHILPNQGQPQQPGMMMLDKVAGHHHSELDETVTMQKELQASNLRSSGKQRHERRRPNSASCKSVQTTQQRTISRSSAPGRSGAGCTGISFR